jgi:hypothetical protein
LAYFSTRIIASRLGPAKPRAIAWNGAGGCLIVSHDRQLNFSRTFNIATGLDALFESMHIER